MTEQDFIIERQKAVERMKKMADSGNAAIRRGQGIATENKKEHLTEPKKPFDINENLFNIPILNKLKNDKDAGIILGLILLLFCESEDRILLAALVYILL